VGGIRDTAGVGLTIWLLPVLVVLGLVLAAWQPLGLEPLLAWGERIGTSWWFLVLLMVVMALLFTFGLPGGLGLWLVAPFNHPLLSTIVLVIASTVGALGAYRLALHLRRDWQPGSASGRVVEALRHGDMLTLLAMRMLPGFPHSLINFASGALRLPLLPFIAATVLGLVVKWGVYATAVHGIADAVEAGDAVNVGTVVPLFALVMLTLLGAWARRHHLRGRTRRRGGSPEC